MNEILDTIECFDYISSNNTDEIEQLINEVDLVKNKVIEGK